MIEVTLPVDGDDNTAVFDTNMCGVIDGALVLYAEGPSGEPYTIAGFAPGAWITFEMVSGDDG